MADMRTILETKKRGGKLAPEEIACFVHGVYDGSVPDYQAAAFLMAVRLMGMDEAETAALTLEMARTGVTALSRGEKCLNDLVDYNERI